MFYKPNSKIGNFYSYTKVIGKVNLLLSMCISKIVILDFPNSLILNTL